MSIVEYPYGFSKEPGRFTGIYRGVVKDNDDLEEKGGRLLRVKVDIPQVYGKKINEQDLPWAFPACNLWGGSRKDGFPYGVCFIPPIESHVWIMFENGDPSRPLYLGSVYGNKDADPETPPDLVEHPSFPNVGVIKFPGSGKGPKICYLGL